MSDPIKTLREALGEASNALGWASSMLIEGVEFYTVREVLHAAQKDGVKCCQALTRAETALTELEALLADAISGLDQALHILAAAKSTTAEEAEP